MSDNNELSVLQGRATLHPVFAVFLLYLFDMLRVISYDSRLQACGLIDGNFPPASLRTEHMGIALRKLGTYSSYSATGPGVKIKGCSTRKGTPARVSP